MDDDTSDTTEIAKPEQHFELGTALRRIFRTWKWGFLIAIIIYGLVFIWAYNYEVHRTEEEEISEDPVELFQTMITPAISTGGKEYTLSIRNDQTYDINELDIEFYGTTMSQATGNTEAFTGNLNAGTQRSYSIDIESGAVSFDVSLDDTEIITGLTNLNLYLNNPNGTLSWSSESAGNSEEIILTSVDIQAGGFGPYELIVAHEGGARSVSYEITYTVEMGSLITKHYSNQKLKPGAETSFRFFLNLDEGNVNEIMCKISSKLEVAENLFVNIELIYDSNWVLLSVDRPIPEDVSRDIPWGPVDLTGTSSATLYTFTVLFGFAFYIRAKLKKIFMPKFIRRAHCFISLITLMFVFAHMSTAMQKDWPWESAGMRFAAIATILLLSFNVYSFFDIEIVRSIGLKKWRLIHVIFTLLMALSIIIHFGLMGDHLGFLK